MIFVGNDWAEGHHDVYLMDDGGARLGFFRLPEWSCPAFWTLRDLLSTG